MAETTNIGGICAACSEERRVSWQEHHEHLVIKEGDFVKIRFQMNGKDNEWMWVEVGDIHGSSTGNMYYGILRNTSVFAPEEWRFGRCLGFYRSDIADYCKDGDFDNYDPWLPTKDGHLHEVRD